MPPHRAPTAAVREVLAALVEGARGALRAPAGCRDGFGGEQVDGVRLVPWDKELALQQRGGRSSSVQSVAAGANMHSRSAAVRVCRKGLQLAQLGPHVAAACNGLACARGLEDGRRIPSRRLALNDVGEGCTRGGVEVRVVDSSRKPLQRRCPNPGVHPCIKANGAVLEEGHSCTPEHAHPWCLQ